MNDTPDLSAFLGLQANYVYEPNDIEELERWAHRAGAFEAKKGCPLNRGAWMHYRPHTLADDAMDRLSLIYPAAMQILRNALRECDWALDELEALEPPEGTPKLVARGMHVPLAPGGKAYVAAKDRLADRIDYLRRKIGVVVDAIKRSQVSVITEPKPAPSPKCEHAADYTSVVWFGRRYTFNPTQAQCIKLLWEHWNRGTPTLREKAIGAEIGSEDGDYRLSHTFRKHPAWGTMIKRMGAGIYGLAEPSSRQNPENPG